MLPQQTEDMDKMLNIYTNANVVLEDNHNTHQNEHSKDKSGVFKPIANNSPNKELYTEKVSVWEKGVIKQVLLVVNKSSFNLIFIDKEIQIMKPLDVFYDIETIVQSSGQKSYSK